MIGKLLMRLARKVVEGVLSQLNQLLNMVQEMAMAPMRQMIQYHAARAGLQQDCYPSSTTTCEASRSTSARSWLT